MVSRCSSVAAAAAAGPVAGVAAASAAAAAFAVAVAEALLAKIAEATTVQRSFELFAGRAAVAGFVKAQSFAAAAT